MLSAVADQRRQLRRVVCFLWWLIKPQNINKPLVNILYVKNALMKHSLFFLYANIFPSQFQPLPIVAIFNNLIHIQFNTYKYVFFFYFFQFLK